MDGNVSLHRQPAATALRQAFEARSAVQRDGPGRFGGPDGQCAPGVGTGCQGAALPAQGDLPADLLLSREYPEVAEGDPGAAVSVVRAMGGGPDAPVPDLRRAQAALIRSRL